MTTKSGPAGADIPGARPTEKGGTLWTPREYRKPHRADHGQVIIAYPSPLHNGIKSHLCLHRNVL
jgi:hypothetical protein